MRGPQGTPGARDPDPPTPAASPRGDSPAPAVQAPRSGGPFRVQVRTKVIVGHRDFRIKLAGLKGLAYGTLSLHRGPQVRPWGRPLPSGTRALSVPGGRLEKTLRPPVSGTRLRRVPGQGARTGRHRRPYRSRPPLPEGGTRRTRARVREQTPQERLPTRTRAQEVCGGGAPECRRGRTVGSG